MSSAAAALACQCDVAECGAVVAGHGGAAQACQTLVAALARMPIGAGTLPS